MREVVFTPRLGAVEGAYRGLSADLVMLRDASVPNLCIVCGTPAHGNRYRAEFQPYRSPAWHVPIFYDVPYWILGKCYVVNFPFCSICTAEHFDIQAARIDEKAGFFRGVSQTFLKLRAEELKGSPTRRLLRSLMGG